MGSGKGASINIFVSNMYKIQFFNLYFPIKTNLKQFFFLDEILVRDIEADL